MLQQLGYIKVDWKRVQSDYNVLKQRNPNINLAEGHDDILLDFLEF